MEIIKEIFTDQNFLGAIIASIVFILLGFLLRRTKIINEHGKKNINAIIMYIAIPSMAFCAFMSDFKESEIISNIMILILDFIFYFIAVVLANLGFFKVNKNKRKIIAILVAVGQLTFFSTPILKAIYSKNVSEVLIPASLMTIPFRFITYIYSFIVISEVKMTKENVGKTLKNIFITPIMICMFAGLLIWLIQNYIFQVEVDGTSYGFLRIDKTCPALYKIFQFGDNLATPTCMLMIGVTLGESDFVSAIKNKLAWLIGVLRTIAVPVFILGLCLIIQSTHLMNFSEYQIAALVIGNGAPVGAVVAAYCVNYQKEGYLASDSIFLSTVLSIISIPLCFVLVKLSMSLPIF